MNGLSYGKISKMPKKYYFGRTVAFCVFGVHNHEHHKRCFSNSNDKPLRVVACKSL